MQCFIHPDRLACIEPMVNNRLFVPQIIPAEEITSFDVSGFRAIGIRLHKSRIIVIGKSTRASDATDSSHLPLSDCEWGLTIYSQILRPKLSNAELEIMRVFFIVMQYVYSHVVSLWCRVTEGWLECCREYPLSNAVLFSAEAIAPCCSFGDL